MARKSAKSKTTRKAKAKTKAKVATKRAPKKSTAKKRTTKKATTKKRVVKKTAASKKKKTKTVKRSANASAASPTKAKSSRRAATSKSAKRVSKPAAAKKVPVKKAAAKKVAPKKAVRKKAVRKKAEPVVPKPPPRKKRLKTPLNAKQLRGFKALLLAKRAELTGDMMNMTNQALNRNSGTGAESSTVPTHLAERGSDNWEQEFTLGLIANEKIVVQEIDAALERIENRTYGICLGTEEPIAIPRLEAKPWAKHGITFATLRDEGRLR